ncbi:hypothetical protein N431DRAFT_382727 [Stipitochalara longipes BDJ]|nr:hypothetical protein N431DRAFT_382727 [Stipitochalara longipes BDJ]
MTRPMRKNYIKAHKKTRTGCLSCKKRKLKCDEAQPHCLRCFQFGIVCEGYRSPPAKISSRKIMAKIPLEVNSESKAAYPKILIMPSSTLKFADEIEERYFNTFQTETVSELAGVFGNPFWHSILLPACHEEPFIKKVAMALAAISTSKKLSSHTYSDQAYRSIIAQQTEFAYKQYQAALKEMRIRLQEASDSRKAVIACLLICCFECRVGNLGIAHAHAISGLKLLEQWIAQHPYRKLRNVGIGSPADYLIEDDTIQASYFFDAQIAGYLDPRPAHIHSRLRHEGDETVAQMPQRFQSIKEAHRYGMLIFRRALHSCREIGELAGDGRLSTTSDYQILGEGVAALSLAPVEAQASRSPIEDMHIFLDQQRQHSLEIQMWRSAFDDLYKRTMLQTNKQERAAAHVLLALSRAYDVAIFQSLNMDNCLCDNFTFEFQEINSLARKAIRLQKSQNPNMDFTFDLSISAALFVSARFCRDRSLRREAISLMKLYGVMEGFFDTEYAIAMCVKVMELEEKDCATDYIPGSSRIRFIEETVHPEQRWCTFHYIRGDEEIARESDFRW